MITLKMECDKCKRVEELSFPDFHSVEEFASDKIYEFGYLKKRLCKSCLGGSMYGEWMKALDAAFKDRDPEGYKECQ